jgi:hypothetical protein
MQLLSQFELQRRLLQLETRVADLAKHSNFTFNDILDSTLDEQVAKVKEGYGIRDFTNFDLSCVENEEHRQTIIKYCAKNSIFIDLSVRDDDSRKDAKPTEQ